MKDFDLDYLVYLDHDYLKIILDKGLTDEQKLKLSIIKAQKHENNG